MRITTIIGFVIAIGMCVYCTIDYVNNFMEFENIGIATFGYSLPYIALVMLCYHAYLEYKLKSKE